MELRIRSKNTMSIMNSESKKMTYTIFDVEQLFRSTGCGKAGSFGGGYPFLDLGRGWVEALAGVIFARLDSARVNDVVGDKRFTPIMYQPQSKSIGALIDQQDREINQSLAKEATYGEACEAGLVEVLDADSLEGPGDSACLLEGD
ncbi:hypothetical protein CRG98_006803 [Punica granatum]|uniref:Uncharacterized protein n=1 Tax=Punica granatum TaxID=22663 RepID=A0A2I0KWU2_PUNGR|nr:hypothetical protein CRG98_006803 [Punica granatum]